MSARKKKRSWKFRKDGGCADSRLFVYMLDNNRLPAHVAVIMDGNGRWAKKNGVTVLQGHAAGIRAMKEIVRTSSDLGIKHLTVYAFSTENWKRSAEEVSGIFRLLVRFVALDLDELDENNVKMNILGDVSRIPANAAKSVDKAVTRLKDNTGLNFNIALNYGGRQEIVDAVRELKDEPVIDEETLSRHMYTGRYGIPDPELIIRTSGEMRVSNFLLWQSAYSEYVFDDCLWPDFTPEEYIRCLEEYQSRKRRFGGR